MVRRLSQELRFSTLTRLQESVSLLGTLGTIEQQNPSYRLTFECLAHKQWEHSFDQLHNGRIRETAFTSDARRPKTKVDGGQGQN